MRPLHETAGKTGMGRDKAQHFHAGRYQQQRGTEVTLPSGKAVRDKTATNQKARPGAKQKLREARRAKTKSGRQALKRQLEESSL